MTKAKANAMSALEMDDRRKRVAMLASRVRARGAGSFVKNKVEALKKSHGVVW